jgi:hypothetical protein
MMWLHSPFVKVIQWLMPSFWHRGSRSALEARHQVGRPFKAFTTGFFGGSFVIQIES